MNKTNKKNKWLIVDGDGKVLNEYRIKLTAMNDLPRLKKITFNRARVVSFEEIQK